ncbi:MAG: response regulator [Alphaproteobacteria bacterium]|nr:response regulator [Alphaproteobacteria bacterium]
MSDDVLAHRYLQTIALDLIATPEEHYLEEFVRAAGKAFEADMVLISRITSTDEPVDAYAIYDASGQADAYSYPLRGTPCELVFQDEKPFVCPSELQAFFPEDADLQDFDLNAYVGLPLNDRNGACFGLIAALWRGTPPNPDAVLDVFRRVEARLVSGVERIDRTRSEKQALTNQLDLLSNRMNVALDSSGIGVWDYALESGELIWDYRMCILYGEPPGTQPDGSDHWVRALHPEDRPAAEAAFQRSFETGEEFHAQFRIIRRDGCVRWIRATAQLVELASSERRMIGCNIDITDDVLRRQELEEKQAAAEAANIAKSQFLANMSHEIRTPLNGVLGMAQLMGRTELSERQQRYISTILSSGRTLLELIDGVLDISRIETGNVQIQESAFSLEDVVETAIGSVAGTAREKGLTLTYDIAPNLADGRRGDVKRLNQVLVNLLGNGVKFTDLGRVRLTVFETDTARLRFEVKDTGIGIDPEQAETLFDRFSQADISDTREFGGAGLGLAICKELITLMGGEISFDSQIGEGSTFWFEVDLPIDASTAHADSLDIPAKTSAETPTRPATTVLIVEDVEHNRDILVDALSAEGYQVRTAENGLVALDVWSAEPIDAILLDLQMPVMSGEEVITAIRKSESAAAAIPIIAITADATRETQSRIQALGADEYFSKPLDLSAMLASLDSQLRMAAE